jgi:hypothetical protein
MTYQGAAGDLLWLLLSTQPGQTYRPAAHGVQLTSAPGSVPWGPLGKASETGALAFTLQLRDLPPGAAEGELVIQGLASAGSSERRLSGARHVVVLSQSVGPDCDENGISDYLDVALGASPDQNHNLIPDACEPSDWYVEASAPPGGNGSAETPFQSLGETLDLLKDGDTVHVGDGIYSGKQNARIDLGSVEASFRSKNGPGACIIDTGLGVDGFLLGPASGEHGTLIEGFTLVGAGTSGPEAHAIWIDRPNAVVRDCVVERWRDDGIRIETGGHGSRIERCVVRLGYQSGIETHADSVTVRECTLIQNSRSGIDATGSDLLFANSLIAGNDVNGGLRVEAGALASNRLVNLTIVGNRSLSSTYGNGGIAIAFSVTPATATEISNCVVWGNQGTTQAGQLSLAGMASPVGVQWSDVQGGAVGVELGGNPAGVLHWGPGDVALDPQFADPDGPDGDPATFVDNDYRLAALSPCIDSASNAAAVGLVDLDGNPRFVDDPLVPDTGLGSAPIVDMGCYEKAVSLSYP